MISFPLFISYSHKDKVLRQELEKWLTNLRDDGVINEWCDGHLNPGDHLITKIAQKMDEAQIILLLVSQNYLSSNACKEEMQYALKDSNKKRVIPIILMESTWKDTGCKDLLVLPDDGYPINSSFWESREKAWLSVYEGIKRVVHDLEHSFETKENFFRELQHVEFVTQTKGETTIDDVFVFPKLSKQKGAFEKETVNLDYFLEKKDKSILIRGRELSGKTAFARWLFLHLKGKYSPILLDGTTIYKSINFDEHFKREFSRQMTGDFEVWEKMDNKVVIIDNYHHKISSNFNNYLADNFVMTIILMDDEEFLLYFKDDPSISEFSIVSIGQFSFAQQEDLIRKWLYLNLHQAINVVDDLEVDKLEAKVNNVITINRIVPRYPFFILSILQSFEAFMPSNLQITAYGHCYQALVTAKLMKKNIKYDDIDSCFNYLRNLSYDIYIYTKDGKLYTTKAYSEFREKYKSQFIIRESLINKIENEDYPIINLSPDIVGFDYPYIYYFFLGMYLAASENESIVNELCKKIHLRENAYILIFIIHHTQNRKLLDTILLHCIYSFEKQPAAELSAKETQFMNNLIAELPRSIISDKDVSKNRLEQRDKKESANNQQDKEEIKNANTDDVSIIEIKKGIKIIDVLGQILKNRAGSFEKQDILEILENTVDLGLRILNLFLSEYRKPEFKEWLIKLLQDAERDLELEKNRKFDDEKRRIFVEKSIQLFGYVVTIGMLNRITESISTEKLVRSMAILSGKKMTPAYEMINFLVSSSQYGIDANNVKTLISKYNKSKNYWAEKTLSYYIQNFINTHHIKYQDRQRISEILNIKYLPYKI
jgi:hypothetical protein